MARCIFTSAGTAESYVKERPCTEGGGIAGRQNTSASTPTGPLRSCAPHAPARARLADSVH
eukprot:669120-Prorocentrum_minimum.AAC.1